MELGLQSGNDKTLKAINRAITRRNMSAPQNSVKGAGIKAVRAYDNRYSGESRKDYINTMNMIIKSGADLLKYIRIIFLRIQKQAKSI